MNYDYNLFLFKQLCIQIYINILGSLIDSIVAVCQSKEDQIDWVQKINKQLDNSCVVNTTSSNPVSLERVSSSLGRLSDYFAHLICKGVITRTLLKLILYTHYFNNIDTSKIVRRYANESNQSLSPCKVKQYCSQGTQCEHQFNESNNYNIIPPRHCSSMVLREDGKIVYGKKILFTPTKACPDLTKLTLYKEDPIDNNYNQKFLNYESKKSENLKSKHLTIPLLNANNKDENIYLSDNRDSTFSLCDLKTSYCNNFCENEKNTEIVQDFQYFKCKDHNSLRSSDSGLADIAIQVTQPSLPAEMSIHSESLHNINSYIFEDDPSSLDNKSIPFEKGVTYRSELYAHWCFKTKLPGICDSGKRTNYI